MKKINEENIKDILKKYFRKDYFKPFQLKIIKSILSKRDTLAVLPTGSGKSLCFQLPSLYFNGTTIVISPLISLMQDQVKQLEKLKIKATYINSSLSPREIEVRLWRLSHNNYKLIYIAPERLKNINFLKICKKISIPLIVVDEAHCISMWGSDFRPNYKTIGGFIQKLKTRPIIAAFTATATKPVIKEIKESLRMKSLKIFCKSPIRNNLALNIFKCKRKDKQLLLLLTTLNKHKNQSGIIFTLTRTAAEQLCKKLLFFNFNSFFNNVFIYHGGQTSKQRELTQKKFLNSGKSLMIATNAFGMGVDKADIRFIIHYQCPSSIESYCQEIGRAGRDLKRAHCYLLFNPKDLSVHKHFILSQSKRHFFKHDLVFLNKVEKLRNITNLCLDEKCIKNEIKKYFLFTNQRTKKQCANKLTRECKACSSCNKTENQLLKKTKNSINKYERYKNIVPSISYDFITLLKPKTIDDFQKIPGIGSNIINSLWILSHQN